MTGWLWDRLLRSRKVHRFFERRFARLEARLAERNRLANGPGVRPADGWRDVPELSDLRRFYAFHDQTCPDVKGIVTERWWRSHFRGAYALHGEEHASLPYAWTAEGDGWRFLSSSEPDTWVYFVSRVELPMAYAVEFDYTPHTVFREQLQLDFAATSLADRHRFILAYNEYLRYQRIERGFWLPDVARAPWTLPLGVPTRIRLEVDGDTFALLADGAVVACWCDRRYRPRPARSLMMFWNGPDARAMSFAISRFKVQFRR